MVSPNSCFLFILSYFWLGGAAPQTLRFLAGGAKPPQTPHLNGRSSHLIEAAKRGRLDQMIFFFGAADDTRAARTSGRTPGRTLSDDTGAADDRST